LKAAEPLVLKAAASPLNLKAAGVRLAAGSCVSALRLDDAEKALRRGLRLPEGCGDPQPHTVSPRSAALFALPRVASLAVESTHTSRHPGAVVLIRICRLLSPCVENPSGSQTFRERFVISRSKVRVLRRRQYTQNLTCPTVPIGFRVQGSVALGLVLNAALPRTSKKSAGPSVLMLGDETNQVLLEGDVVVFIDNLMFDWCLVQERDRAIVSL